MNKREISRTTTSERYVIDGKEYDRLEDIPPSERKKLESLERLFEDKDNDGIPDVLQKTGVRTSYSTSKEVHISSSKDTEGAAGLLKDVMTDGLRDRFSASKSEREAPNLSSRLYDQWQEDDRKQRVRNYVVIGALMAVALVLFFVLFDY